MISKRHDFFKKRLQELGVYDKDSDYGGMLGKSVEELSETFAKQGHSGTSAELTLALFSMLFKEWDNQPSPLDLPDTSGGFVMDTPLKAMQDSPAPSIVMRMEQLSKTIDEALDCLKSLEDKLGPIMIAPPTGGAGLLQEQEQLVISDVQARLIQVINRAHGLAENIRRIRNSVDL